MNYIDYVILIAYLLLTIGFGCMLGRKQTNNEDFFLMGRRMTWWPIAISIFATFFSSISYIAMPGEAYNFGMTMWLGGFVGFLPLPIMIIFFLQLFYRLKLWTSYEYLERRFGPRTRALGSCSFLLLRVVYLGIVLYATATLLHDALGWPMHLSIIIIGLIGTIYTVFGGMAAVVWTDVVQFFVLMGGVVVVIVFVAMHVDGGMMGIWEKANAMGHGFDLSKKSGFWDFDFSVRISFWAWLIGTLPCCIGGVTDQVNLQRCLTCKSFKNAAGAVAVSSVGGTLMCFLFYFAGLAVLVYFKLVAPGLLPEANKTGDKAFTWFVVNVLPLGFRGVLVAAILSAVLSTITSVINSLTAVTVKDIYQRFINTTASEAYYLKFSKVSTAVWGLLSILCGLGIVGVYAARDIPLLEVSQAALGMLGGFLLGLFVVGLLTKRGNSGGVAIGFILGMILTLYVYITRILLLPVKDRLSFMWIGLLAIFSVTIFGYIASLVLRAMGWGKVPADVEKYVVWFNVRELLGLKAKEKEPVLSCAVKSN